MSAWAAAGDERQRTRRENRLVSSTGHWECTCLCPATLRRGGNGSWACVICCSLRHTATEHTINDSRGWAFVNDKALGFRQGSFFPEQRHHFTFLKWWLWWKGAAGCGHNASLSPPSPNWADLCHAALPFDSSTLGCGVGKKKPESLQIHCPGDRLEGKNGLVRQDLFLLKKIGLLILSGLSALCLLPEAFWNTAAPRKEGRGIYPSFSQGEKLRHQATNRYLRDYSFCRVMSFTMPGLARICPQCCYNGWQSPSTSRLIPGFGF